MSLVKKLIALGVFAGAMTIGGTYLAAEKEKVKKESALEQKIQGDFSPMELGREWEYKTTIPENGAFYFTKDHFSELGAWEVNMRPFPGEHRTKYSIASKVNEGYRLNVEKDDLDFFRNADFVFLKTQDIKDDKVVKFEVKKDFDYVKSTGYTITRGTKDLETYYWIGVGDTAFYVHDPKKGSHEITVPAGTFKCKKSIRKNYPVNRYGEKEKQWHGSSKGKPGYDGWFSIVYSAPNVGEVKIEQYDLNKRLLNTTELISYKIGGQNDSKK
jgi:hypothetical protein